MDAGWWIYALLGVALLLLAGAGGWLFRLRGRDRALAAQAARAEEERRQLLEAAHKEADAIAREARILANEEVLKLREQTEQLLARRRLESDEVERHIAERERLVNRQLERLADDDQRLRTRTDELDRQQGMVSQALAEAQAQQGRRREEMARVAGLSPAEAREALLREVRDEAQRDAGALAQRIVEDARLRAEDKARRILSIAVQRYASDYTFESTTATVALTGDDLKGRIIGREGRNIRAFENSTGVTVLIDDTPNAVVLSGFDPVKREIARDAMERLIADGRIHPTRIEEIVEKSRQDINNTVMRLGEEAVAKVGLVPVHLEVAKLLGKLRFRHSFSQNLLSHSVEVAHLCGLLAAELGVDTPSARRAGLLHDIGKAVSHEMEGPHALVGADLLRRYGEAEEIVNAVASHHEEVESNGPLGVLVGAADAISAARPGARSETLTTYLQRVENLEKIAQAIPGVEKCYAVQAGRELRVLVQPERVSDEQALALARGICRKIEDQLQYPGQIRVTVIRETRCVEFAK